MTVCFTIGFVWKFLFLYRQILYPFYPFLVRSSRKVRKSSLEKTTFFSSISFLYIQKHFLDYKIFIMMINPHEEKNLRETATWRTASLVKFRHPKSSSLLKCCIATPNKTFKINYIYFKIQIIYIWIEWWIFSVPGYKLSAFVFAYIHLSCVFL